MILVEVSWVTSTRERLDDPRKAELPPATPCPILARSTGEYPSSGGEEVMSIAVAYEEPGAFELVLCEPGTTIETDR